MNWYIGQEIVCIKSHSEDIVKEGQIYKIKGLRSTACKCDNIDINVGLFADPLEENEIYTNKCDKCGFVEYTKDEIYWICETLFAPLEYDQKAIEELMRIEQPIKSVTP